MPSRGRSGKRDGPAAFIREIPYFSGDVTPFMEFDRAKQDQGLTQWARQTTDEERELHAKAGFPVPAGTLTKVTVLVSGLRSRSFVKAFGLDESRDGMILVNRED